MSMLICSSEKPRRCILNRLKVQEWFIADIKEEGAAVVQSSEDKGVNNVFKISVGEEGFDFTDCVEMEERTLCDFCDVSTEVEMRTEDDTKVSACRGDVGGEGTKTVE